MKSGDKLKVSVIRLLLAAIRNTEIARQVSELADVDVLGVISKEIKQRQESITAFEQGNRTDLASQEKAEMTILQAYLPQQATRDEITTVAKLVIAEVNAQTVRDKGKVMPRLITHFKGKADGKVINDIVTELLG